MDLELCIGNTVHYRRPRNHPDVEMWLNQMSAGQADSYIIRAARFCEYVQQQQAVLDCFNPEKCAWIGQQQNMAAQKNAEET